MTYEIDKSPVDPWTAVHFAVGFIAGEIGVPWWAAIGIAIVWEIVENWNRPDETIPWMSPDSNANAIIDVVAVAVGWWIGNKLASAQ